MAKRRGQYEQQVVEDPRRYDSWFDYVRLEEAQATAELDLARKEGAVGAGEFVCLFVISVALCLDCSVSPVIASSKVC